MEGNYIEKRVLSYSIRTFKPQNSDKIGYWTILIWSIIFTAIIIIIIIL